MTHYPLPFRTNIITKDLVELHKAINADKPSIWWTYTSLKNHLNTHCKSHEEYDYGIRQIVEFLGI